MQIPRLPEDESERLTQIQKLDILDTPSEVVLDDLTRLASMMCGTLYATISIIDRDRQWFKSVEGPLESTETSRDVSFCGHAMLEDDLFIIEDALADERFTDNPLVTGGPMIRFYAGAPLKTPDGFPIGTLCVLDPEPGSLTAQQREALRLLARQVEDKLTHRIATAVADNVEGILEHSDAYLVLYDPVQERVNYISPKLRQQLSDLSDDSSRILFSRIFPDLPYERFFAAERMKDSSLYLPKITRTCLPNQPHGHGEIRLVNTQGSGRHDVILLLRDRTELDRSLEAANEAETNLRIVFKLAEQSVNPFIITDAQGQITWVNAGFETMTGYSKAEAMGQKPGRLLQGKDTSPQDWQRISRHLKARKPVVQEILNYTKNGERYWNKIYIQPILDNSENLTHFAATQINITDQKKSNLQLRDSRDEAERANIAKSRLLAKISHELRTPLNGIVGIAETLSNEVPETLKSSVTTLNVSSQHLMTLLDGLLDLAQIESGLLELDHKPFRPAELVQSVAQLFESRAQMVGNMLTLDISENLPAMVRGDATRLRQILINLVSNAVKSTQKGSIIVRAETVKTEAPALYHGLRFSVRDSGPGIEAKTLKQNVENFLQFDNWSTKSGEGSGLGLAVSKQLVEAMGGEVHVDSKPGKGAAFSFTLNFAKLDVSDLENQNKHSDLTAALARAQTILVMDDDPVSCSAFIGLLRRFDIPRVYSAMSAKQGLEILENIQPDLVFIDLPMLEINESKLVEHLQALFTEQGRPLPLLAACCTDDVSSKVKQEFLAAGFDAHISKPVTGSSLSTLLYSFGFHCPVPALDTSTEPESLSEGTATGLKTPPHVNFESLMGYFLENRDLVKEFLMLTVANLPLQANQIWEAIRTGAVNAHEETAESIKGLVGYFEDTSLKENVSALETAMNNGQTDLARDLFPEVDNALHAIVEEADRLLKTLEEK